MSSFPWVSSSVFLNGHTLAVWSEVYVPAFDPDDCEFTAAKWCDEINYHRTQNSWTDYETRNAAFTHLRGRARKWLLNVTLCTRRGTKRRSEYRDNLLLRGHCTTFSWMWFSTRVIALQLTWSILTTS